MARVNLRDYLREIDDLIENGRTDEAIAHSRYILELYPKHIDSYRLLGKAYLETQRYSDAADVLQRVLSSIPDDYISNLGMSIIREDEGNLDAAIWFMERTFEVQPSNAAIQEELRRLYGRRDGLEPSKVHLTRGALARMYAKGELYEQAIAEIRATLAQEPQRTDLQVLLAQLYAKNGQHVDAVRTCRNIIQKSPYCQDANQLLAEKLPGTERSEEARNYQGRLQALDPYAAHISASAPSTQQVPDNVITLERYEWTPGDSGSDSETRPDWATSLGVDIGSSASVEDALPEWLVETNDTEKTPAFEPGSVDIESISSMDDKNGQPIFDPQDETELTKHAVPQIEDDSADSEDLVPEWMKSAGWELSDKPSEETQSQFTKDDNSAINDDELEPAELPDWLESMSPASTETEHKTPEPEDDSASDEPVNWLDEKTPGATDSIVTWLQTKDQLEIVDDADIESVQAPESISIEPSEEAEDYLQLLDEQEGAGPDRSLLQETEQASIDDKPDWLPDIGEETSPGLRSEISMDPINEFESPENIEPQDAEYLPDENIPEWLRDLSDETSINGPTEPLEEIGSDISGVAAKPTQDLERLQDLGEPTLNEENLDLPGDKELEHLDDQAQPEAGTQPEVGIPEWLQSLGDETVIEKDLDIPLDLEGASPEEIIQPKAHEQPPEDLPEWLQTLREEPIEDVALDTSAVQIGEPLKEIEDPEFASQQEKDIPEMLDDLSAELPIDESWTPSKEIEEAVDAVISDESVPTQTGEIPEWVQALGSETSAGESADSETVPDDDIPELQEALGEEIKTEEAFEPISKTGEALMDHEGKIPDLGPEDEDAALAWMESLAAKQGVDEEELLTAPDERKSAPPDWVQQLSSQSKPIEKEDEEIPEAITTDEIDETDEQVPDLELEPSRLSLETTSEPPEETEGGPDWLQDLIEETTTEEIIPMLDEQATDIKQTDEETEPADDQVPDWILELAEESIDIPAEDTIEESALIEGDTQPITITEDEPEPSEVFSPELEVVRDTTSSEEEIDFEAIETIIEERIEEVTLHPLDDPETTPSIESEIPDWLKRAAISESAQPAEEIIDQELETAEWSTAEDVEESIQPSEPLPMAETEKAEDELEIPEWIISEDVVEEVFDTPEALQPLEEKIIEDEFEIPEWRTDEFSAEPELSDLLQSVETELVEEQPEISTEPVDSAAEEPSEIPIIVQPLTEEEVEEESEIPDWISDQEAETGIETVEPILPIEAEKKDEEPEITEWIEAEKVEGWFEESEPVESIGVDFPEEIKPIPEPMGKPDIEEIVEARMSIDSPEMPDEALSETLVEDSPPPLVNLNNASFKVLKRLPGIGPVLAQTIIDYRAAHGVFPNVDSLQDVPGIGSITLEILRDSVNVETKEEPVSLPGSPEEKNLRDGRSALEKGNISEAYDQYSKLIEDEQLLDNVIEDMKEALYRYPIEVSIYELLGDAYLRTDQIREAIDTYTKAEELLK